MIGVVQQPPQLFPFGEPLQLVQQFDRTPKKIFVLGVYASAVHARWLRPNGSTAVKALAVASEPCIFWPGDDADRIISRIAIPPEVGRLVPADPQFNGPSGVALDELILEPLGFRRGEAWLCDLVPHSCINASQQAAITRSYLPLARQYGLPIPNIPPVPRQLADDTRRAAILEELQESRAEELVLLGDEPIKWFLRHFDDRRKRLSDFTPYGSLCDVKLGGIKLNVRPLAHPRQIAKLGQSSDRWFAAHQAWCQRLRGNSQPGFLPNRRPPPT